MSHIHSSQRIWFPLLFVIPLIVVMGTTTPVNAQPQQLVKQKVKALFSVHRRAKKALLRAAGKPVIADYFREHSPEKKDQLRQEIEKLTLNIQRYFKVSEMCLIDEKGHEITRIEHGEIAHDLSTEEAKLPFFKSGFEAAEEEVVTSPL